MRCVAIRLHLWDFLCVDVFFNIGCAATAVEHSLISGTAGRVRPYQKIIELLTVTPDDAIAGIGDGHGDAYWDAYCSTGLWPWETRKTWYRTKPIVLGADIT